MWWNNFVNIVFVIWVFYAPMPICLGTRLTSEAINYLLIFDVVFMLDRVLDLFVGF